ncbi:fumarylacetoacetate hydrolase family protein [Mucilaginibacter polytrichastri]|uniref:Ureidoglycolate lyase n=1 Tax=Mucilaginibacter polytrichastri TaxID=1302689 RepID=A0A1Q6A532_9SPHI|nr:fumarylacetoacetate hydrolase family protein [Mucilaginibacter polytrichastri]OKS89107.1 Ureidoglycolate lyase [Mucilaginibacter polytrichastri]SFS96604.1 2-keto-4-pentenoate hydratase/2-oxohepta-3-ene-1,7-dioic acid hydratase (catechol pathway) [Mucilaginibacter polytrichastri]
MKLIRYGQADQEKPGVLIDDTRYDVSAYIDDYNETFFTNNGIQRLETLLADKKSDLIKVAGDIRLGSPIARPSKIVCVGLNYTDHAIEVGAKIPSEPVIFIKSNTALNGPNDAITIPQGSEKTDWETELAVVIGKKASYIKEADVKNYIAGYVLHNDVSERAFMFERNGTWDKGKGCDTFAPIGPYIVTPDEMPDIDNLHIWLKLNGELMQNGTTADMIFKTHYLVAYITQFMTLLPGDIVSTGTPAGSGIGLKPPVFLKPGDIMELGIDGLGSQRQTVQAYGQV